MAFSAVLNVFRVAELRSRLLFTLALLTIYRLGIFIHTPGINRAALDAHMKIQRESGGLLNFFNFFSGGALEQMSIFALGIMPYVSASIVMSLLTVVIPALDRLNKEGALGRRKINQYTRYGTILLSIAQGIGIANIAAGMGRSVDAGPSPIVVESPDFWFYSMTIITLTAGTAFIMWLGERITESGIGNGISLIIFAGIVARLPAGMSSIYTSVKAETLNLGLVLILLAFMLLVVGAVVYIERGMRRIPIQYAKRVSGQRVFSGQASYFPLKVNAAGVIPPIFASTLLSLPATLSSYLPFLRNLQYSLQSNLWVYNGVFVFLIVFFAFFYTSLTFRPDDIADNIKKNGGYIPGLRPGRQTADYISRVLNRLTAGGAIYLAMVCVVPTVISGWTNLPIHFGGTGLLIVVGVALDTVQQIEQHLITKNYEGFSGPRGPRIRGRIRMGA
ncbi:MAG: preprotein translocase subunit SecY [Cystobacterineae bacterium]|nr:preprotein translocase subunit SecY [Cystobacterineae bacterium]